MKFQKIEIANYKSLHNVSVKLSDLTVFVGANASGKSNLTEALDFIGEVYQLGLESAIARKGGYENIAFRRARRAKAPIRFIVEIEAPHYYSSIHRRLMKAKDKPQEYVRFIHAFSFKAKSTAIDAPYEIISESLKVYAKLKDFEDYKIAAEYARNKNGKIVKEFYSRSPELKKFLRDSPFSRNPTDFFFMRRYRSTLGKTQLVFTGLMDIYLRGGRYYYQQRNYISSFQLNPRSCRESGIPTPNPELHRYGANLPAMISFLKREHIEIYEKIVPTLRQVFPSLHQLNLSYTHTKALALQFQEIGFKRPWTAEDVSDGTITTLAILVAIFNPANSMVVIEEPENSMHPWGIRSILKAIRTATESKQIVLTTHSPVVVDSVRPEEVAVVNRNSKGWTNITPLIDLDNSIAEQWHSGTSTLANILDSGSVPEAVPGA